MTIFDYADALAVSAAVVVFIASRQWAVGWGVGSLVLFHLAGRNFIANGDMLDIAALQTVMAIGFLLGPFLTVYGRMIGTIYAVLSMASVLAYVTGNVPSIGAGLGFNIWNLHSLGLHSIAGLTIIGTLRYGRISSGNRPHHY